jgi:hypothetical protein
MPLSSLYIENGQAAYERARDIIDFHAQLIAIAENISVDEADRKARTESEEAYFAALTFDPDGQS